MSYLRPGHAMRHVDGVSEDYVYDDGFQIIDYGKVSDAGLIEMLGRYFHTRKYGRDDMFEKYIMQRLAMRMDVQLRPRPLSKSEWMSEDGKIWRAAQKEVKEILGGRGKGEGSKSSSLRISKNPKVLPGMSSVSINVARHSGSYINVTRQGLSAKSR